MENRSSSPDEGNPGSEYTREAYLELKRRYDNLFGKSVAAIFRTTIEGRFLECNEAMARMLGYPDTHQLMGRSARELYFSEKERDVFLEELKKQRQLLNYVISLKHLDGSRVDVLENVYLDDVLGQPLAIQGMAIDITALKQSEAQQRALLSSYRGLIEHIQDGLLLVQNGLVCYENTAARHLFERDLLHGIHVDELFRTNVMELLNMNRDGIQVAGSGPFPVISCTGRFLRLFVADALHEGNSAQQLTLRDEQEQQHLYQEQLRARMAEEVNEVLREEITEHRRTRESLLSTKRFSRILVDSSLDMIVAADPEGNLTEFNPAACGRFGRERDDVLGINSRVLYADQDQYDRVQSELVAQGSFAGEILNVDRRGEVFTTFLAASRLFDPEGRLLGTMGVSRDITRMKHDQEALRNSEERYRDLFENATELIQSVDAEGRFLNVNKAWREVLGYSEDDVQDLTIWDIIRSDKLEDCKQLFDEVFRHDRSIGIRTVFVGKDGREVVVEGNTNLRKIEGMPAATRSIFRDLTKEKEAERQVHDHEAKWKALFESSEHMFWTVDPQVKLTSFNRGYSLMIERLHGHVPEINTDPDEPRKRFAPTDYHDFWDRQYAQAFKGEPLRFETHLVDLAGERVCNEIFLSPVFNELGEVREVFGVGHEITELKQAEDRVREQSARLNAIFDSSANMMIWTLDLDLRITSFNLHFRNSIENDFGVRYKVGDAFLVEEAHQAAGKDHGRLLAKYMAALEGRPQHFEAELIDSRGATTWVESFLNPIVVDGRIQEISCLAHNITERKEAQIELMRSLQEKEVLLKEVHHRVKNNLQVVSSILNLQLAFVGDDERLLQLLRDNRDRIRSMSFIHESLYQNKDFSSIDLAGYVDGLCRNLMLSYRLTGKVALEMDLKPVELLLDQAIPCGLILNELISNTLKHAFPNDRTGIIRIGLDDEADMVRIRLSDDGVGVDDEFDPQRDGRLGLELVLTLVQQLDGVLTMDNEGGLSYLLTFERNK